MSRAIISDSRLHIRFSRKHALASSSDWTITLTEARSKTSRWLDTLLSTGSRMSSLGMRQHASRMGWNVCLMPTGHTLRRGFAFTTKIGEVLSCLACVPRNPKQPPLYYATFIGFRDLAEHLIAKHPEHINARGGREVIPMHVAALAGHADLLSLLVDCGADVDDRGTFVWTPLHRASWNGELEAGQCPLDHGADVDSRDEDGWTPLFQAVYHGHLRVRSDTA